MTKYRELEGSCIFNLDTSLTYVISFTLHLLYIPQKRDPRAILDTATDKKRLCNNERKDDDLL